MLQCSIIRDTDGNISEVLAPNGLSSQLFNALKEYADGNADEALRNWAAVHTPSFIKDFGNWQDIRRVYAGTTPSSGEAVIFSQQPTSDVTLENIDDLRFVDTRTGFLDLGDSQVTNMVKLFNNRNKTDFKLDLNDPNLAQNADAFFKFAAASKIRGFYAGPKVDSNILIVLDTRSVSNYETYKGSLDANGEPIFYVQGGSIGFNKLRGPKITEEELKSSLGERAKRLVTKVNEYAGQSAQSVKNKLDKEFGAPGTKIISPNNTAAVLNKMREYNVTEGGGKLVLRFKPDSPYNIIEVVKEPVDISLSYEEALNLSGLKLGTLEKIKNEFSKISIIPELNAAYESLVNSYVSDIERFTSKGLDIDAITQAYIEAQDKLMASKTTGVVPEIGQTVKLKDGQTGNILKAGPNKFRILLEGDQVIDVSRNEVTDIVTDGVPVSLKLDDDFKESFNISKSVIQKYIENPENIAKSISNVRESNGDFVKFEQSFLNAIKCK